MSAGMRAPMTRLCLCLMLLGSTPLPDVQAPKQSLSWISASWAGARILLSDSHSATEPWICKTSACCADCRDQRTGEISAHLHAGCLGMDLMTFDAPTEGRMLTQCRPPEHAVIRRCIMMCYARSA